MNSDEDVRQKTGSTHGMPDDGVTACPDCGDHQVRRRPSRPAPIGWYCDGCGHRFAEPVIRADRRGGNQYAAGGDD
jgi:ribosomal protein L37AE/L43A